MSAAAGTQGAGTAPPGLSGDWDMAIDWRSAPRFWWGKSGKVSARAILYNRPNGFGMEVHSSGSDSTTKIAHWTTETVGSPVLHYVYDVVPKANAPQGADAYSGAAILHYYPNDDELRGNYWTSRMTVGEFRLSRLGTSQTSTLNNGTRTRKGGYMKMRWLGALVTLVLVAAVLWFLLGRRAEDDAERPQTNIERQISFAVDQASKICLMNLSQQEQRSIETGVREKLRQYSAGGYSAVERTRRSVNEAFSEAGQIEQGRQQAACMANQTDKFLAVAKRMEASPGASASAALDPAAAGFSGEAGTSTGPATGYVYYEEDRGKLTVDGVFGPLNGPAPQYGALHQNQVLRSTRAAQLRAEPSGSARLVKMLEAGQCVQIVADPKWPQSGLTRATSGGRVSVQAISCPAGS